MNTVKTITRPFDAADYLDNEESIAAYLSEALAAGDMAHFQAALQTAARARNDTEHPSRHTSTAGSVNLTIQPAPHHS